MEYKMKLLVGGLTLLLILTIYWNFLSTDIKETDTKDVTISNKTENLELNLKEGIVSEKITVEDNTQKESQTLKYKDVFKAPKEVQSVMEKITQREELSTLNSDIESLILEADEFIENKGLVLEEEIISPDEKAQHDFKVEEMENKLDKLETN